MGGVGDRGGFGFDNKMLRFTNLLLIVEIAGAAKLSFNVAAEAHSLSEQRRRKDFHRWQTTLKSSLVKF
jgi:hypothetical protein